MASPYLALRDIVKVHPVSGEDTLVPSAEELEGTRDHLLSTTVLHAFVE